jgi:hypothetical protein
MQGVQVELSVLSLFNESRLTPGEEKNLNGSKKVSVVGTRGRRAQTAHVTINHVEGIRRVRAVPPEVGFLLIVSGIGGILLPGPVGTPFLILGCITLWPRAFRQTGKFFEGRFPRMHYHGVKQINRFLDDLERRYPPSR